MCEFRKEDYARSARVILWWVLNIEKPLHPPSASVGFFYCQSLQKQAFDGFPIKNPGALRQGFFFVAECDEISNLRLVEDICKILEFMDTEVDMEAWYCCSL
jgi:hypothetical protein